MMDSVFTIPGQTIIKLRENIYVFFARFLSELLITTGDQNYYNDCISELLELCHFTKTNETCKFNQRVLHVFLVS